LPPWRSSDGRRSRWSTCRPNAIAKAREASTIRAAQARPQADVASEYLLAHQEFSPAMAIQSGAPYLRAATATAIEPQPKP
jgi:hypothetical protein